MTDFRVQEFWVWFMTHAAHMAGVWNDELIISELEEQLSKLGKFVWELGPGKVEKNSFTISPGGDRALLPRTREIVAGAPRFSGWEFYSAKPPKRGFSKFEMKGEDGQMLIIDTRIWRYAILSRKTDGSRLLMVETPNLSQLSDVYRRWAVEIALDGLIGEELRLQTIEDLMVVARFDPRIAERSAPFENLKT